MNSNLNYKQKAIALLKSLENGDQTALEYVNPKKYIEHNLAYRDGFDGIKALLKNKSKEGFKINIIRVFQNGDYVFAHSEFDFDGGHTGFDVFRFEDGLIVEHWDNLIDKSKANISGHEQADGTTEINNLENTAYNKTFIDEFINTILDKREYDKLAAFFDDEKFIQHNKFFGDDVAGKRKGMKEMENQGITTLYIKNHIILGEGNFVLAISEGKFGGEHTSFYDLFRIKSGKIVEHWDVVETIAPKSAWKNNNGKFNFF